MLNYRLIHDEGATTASTVTYLLPIVAVTLGAVVLGEPITWNLFAGTIIVLAGVALSQRRRTSALPALSQRLRASTCTVRSRRRARHAPFAIAADSVQYAANRTATSGARRGSATHHPRAASASRRSERRTPNQA